MLNPWFKSHVKHGGSGAKYYLTPPLISSIPIWYRLSSGWSAMTRSQPSSQAVQMGTKWSAGQIIDESLSSVERSLGWAGLGWAGLAGGNQTWKLSITTDCGIFIALLHDTCIFMPATSYFLVLLTPTAYCYCLSFHFDVMCNTFYNGQISSWETGILSSVSVSPTLSCKSVTSGNNLHNINQLRSQTFITF